MREKRSRLRDVNMNSIVDHDSRKMTRLDENHSKLVISNIQNRSQRFSTMCGNYSNEMMIHYTRRSKSGLFLEETHRRDQDFGYLCNSSLLLGYVFKTSNVFLKNKTSQYSTFLLNYKGRRVHFYFENKNDFISCSRLLSLKLLYTYIYIYYICIYNNYNT